MKDEIKERIKYFKHYVVDNLSLDAQDDFQKILNCITNLQEENKKLKQLCDRYEEEHNTEFKIWKDERCQLLDYKQRNEKAVEYIKEHQRKDEFLNLNEWQTRELLEILDKVSDEK